MEPFSFIPLTLASVLASFSGSPEDLSESVIAIHVMPEIAGAWELDLSTQSNFVHPNRVEGSDTLEPEDANLNQLIDTIHQSDDLTLLVPEASKNFTSMKTNSNSKSSTCHERYNFAADNKVTTTSGEEWTYGTYFYNHQENGLPVISIYTDYDSKKEDCSGLNIDQTGETIYAFVDYKPKENKMYWCLDNQGKDCFMTFKKLLP